MLNSPKIQIFIEAIPYRKLFVAAAVVGFNHLFLLVCHSQFFFSVVWSGQSFNILKLKKSD